MDEYNLLRPNTDDSPCDCQVVEQLLLVYIMTANPIRCFHCKGYVDPERLGLSANQTRAVSKWQNVFGSLYDLWLDSGEYETWAEAALLQPQGAANTRGMVARDELATVLPTFYWWFHHEELPYPQNCPRCQAATYVSAR